MATFGGTEATWALWAKWNGGEPPTYHPLLCHMLDVAQVARALWREVIPGSGRRWLSDALGVGEESSGRWVAFWAGLHDIGKASPAFQLQLRGEGLDIVRARLQEARLRYADTALVGKNPHGTISTKILREVLRAKFGLPGDLATRVGMAVGGHHGVIPTSGDVQDLSRDGVGTGRWDDVRLDLVKRLATALEVHGDTAPARLGNSAAMFLAGLVSVADWIGSNEEYFPHEARDARLVPEVDLEEYAGRAEERALAALNDLGWLGWNPAGRHVSFHQMFPFIHGEPRPVQAATIELARRLDRPGMVIVEAPMGEGKTEAAMYLADHWCVTLGQRGCYFALPTTATSDQMFTRVRDFLKSRYPESVVNLQLIHGHASLSAEFEELQRSGHGPFVPEGIEGPLGSDGAPANVVAAQWFTARKRSLLAPFGVGTVDQVLLAVLQTRHLFVRLFGLASKTVIVDEVHAYDTYMTTLLSRLLEWLGALGCSVVLLSATLPRARREQLLEAYALGAGWELSHPPSGARYPRIAWSAEDGSGERHVGTSEMMARSVTLEWVDGSLPGSRGGAFPLGGRLREALSDGGCAAVVCNTVRRAQEVYQALKPYFEEAELDLLHARYLFRDRDVREKRALRRFGKDSSERPRRLVLVSTQIIEQSLDLDFDLMVTDLAPADLVLQRAGRLHRHERPRPERLARPTLWICSPRVAGGGVPEFDRGTEAVYEAHVLLRSWLELRDRGSIAIPGDVEGIVEAVYDDRPCPDDLGAALRARWEETRSELERAIEDEEQEAKIRYIRWPGFRGHLAEVMGHPREEDAPDLHPAHQALTRLIELSVPVVCLYSAGEGLSLDLRGTQIVDPRQRPDIRLARHLLERSVTITDRRIAYQLIREDTPSGWLKSPLLRGHRLIALDAAGAAVMDKYRLRLDEELGLVVEDGTQGKEEVYGEL